jgi:small ubiquitin-related modifier
MADEKDKDDKKEKAHLQLTIKGNDNDKVYFKVKKSTKLKKLMDAYCGRLGVQAESVRFMFDGDRLNPESSAEDAGMEDGDEIDAMVEQTGGSSVRLLQEFT